MNDTAPVDAGQADAAPVDSGQATDTAPAATEAPIWYDGAPDEVKGYIQNKGWDSPLKAVEGYQNLEKFQGVGPDQLIKLPKEGEPMDEVYNKLGRPESADKYDWSAPDGVNVDENYLGTIKSAAYEAGVSQKAFEKLASAHAEYELQVVKQTQEAQELEQTNQLNKLQQEWGSKFDERAELGRRFVMSNMPNDLDKTETLDKIETAIGTAAMLKLFANSGEKFKEAKLPDSGGDTPFGYSPEQATADRKELMQAVQADPARLRQYNTGKGNDFDKLKKINEVIANR